MCEVINRKVASEKLLDPPEILGVIPHAKAGILVM